MNLYTRPLRPTDDAELRRVFPRPITLGRPVPRGAAFDAALRPYESLCLEWYLRAGRKRACVVLRHVPDRRVAA